METFPISYLLLMGSKKNLTKLNLYIRSKLFESKDTVKHTIRLISCEVGGYKWQKILFF